MGKAYQSDVQDISLPVNNINFDTTGNIIQENTTNTQNNILNFNETGIENEECGISYAESMTLPGSTEDGGLHASYCTADSSAYHVAVQDISVPIQESLQDISGIILFLDRCFF